jgi:rhodanese-related sulfurtransferase
MRSVEVDMCAPYFVEPSTAFRALFGPAPAVILDVRRPEAIAESDRLLPGSRVVDPADASGLARGVDRTSAVIVACAHGEGRSQGIAAILRSEGIAATTLSGGFEAWRQGGFPLARRNLAGVVLGGAPSTWITRRRPKIDRVACPWLVSRFLDARARVLFVEPGQVLEVARETGGISFDLPGAVFEHDGELCTFDTLLTASGLDMDPHLRDLAAIVRGADTDRLDLAPQCAGLLAVSLGLSARCDDDDHALLRHGFGVYDALYCWLREARQEIHNWPRAGLGRAA